MVLGEVAIVAFACFVAFVVAIVVARLFSDRRPRSRELSGLEGSASEGTKFVEDENGQIVRRSTRWVGCAAWPGAGMPGGPSSFHSSGSTLPPTQPNAQHAPPGPGPVPEVPPR